MSIKHMILLVIVGFVFVGCKQKEETPESQSSTPHPAMSTAMAGMHNAVVQEVLQATEYTYLNVKEGDKTFWMAVTKRDIKVGETVAFAPGLEMKNFASKDLQRTFDSVYFIDTLTTAGQSAMPAMSAMPGTQNKPVLAKQEVSVEPVDGGITIGELYGDRATYGDQTVTIRGKVSKVNVAIMGKNWLHIQDGTESDGNYDLTVTTQGKPAVGDVVVVKGKISLNRDFGAGYKYDVIMEDATCEVE